MKPEARLTSDLPERYARLYDYRTGKFETPLDSQGIANIDSIFEIALRTYPDELPCLQSSERNIHHVYGTEQWWQEYAMQHESPDRETIQTFRNSTPQLAYVPKLIHAWIEEITIWPPPPTMEVMRKRNANWLGASVLLRCATMLDRARDDYTSKKDTTRTVLGKIEGITPRSQQSDVMTEERVNREYWLSELNGRLEGWRYIVDKTRNAPPEYQSMIEPKLVSIRALRKRIKNGAMIPRLPADLIAV